MLRLTARMLLLMLVMASYSAPLRSQEGKIEPHDEALTDVSWAVFRARLLTAIEKRDRQFVLGVLDPNIRNGADAPRGIAEFRKQWHLDDNNSPFWQEMTSALSLGSAWLTREKKVRELCAPYVLAKWPEHVEPTHHGVIIAREALVKSEPSSAAATFATLSYQIVPVPDWEVNDRDASSKQKWVKILVNGLSGYVPEEQIRSPIEHAACFVRTENGWRLIVFGPAGRD